MNNLPEVVKERAGFQIIEVNGVKMEVDLRQAKVVEQYRVGDNVKVLIKEYQSYKSYPGVIIGFDTFEKLPTINIMYVKTNYSAAELIVVNFNAKSEDVEIAPMHDYDKLDRADIVGILNRDIEKKRAELHEMESKKAYFLQHFDKKLSSVILINDTEAGLS